MADEPGDDAADEPEDVAADEATGAAPVEPEDAGAAEPEVVGDATDGAPAGAGVEFMNGDAGSRRSAARPAVGAVIAPIVASRTARARIDSTRFDEPFRVMAPPRRNPGQRLPRP
jgi:hypothetical protein